MKRTYKFEQIAQHEFRVIGYQDTMFNFMYIATKDAVEAYIKNYLIPQGYMKRKDA